MPSNTVGPEIARRLSPVRPSEVEGDRVTIGPEADVVCVIVNKHKPDDEPLPPTLRR
ncbi:hypothetical protein ACH35V_32625 [Actinomadura sp. 1N219]|uniref:hypothetical protein n=1 Tax=Actinomadura sp. 1N219 TaxID=3375152 RepID=UPI0037BCE93A